MKKNKNNNKISTTSTSVRFISPDRKLFFGFLKLARQQIKTALEIL
ncbi:hypothetical protein KY339_03295 [Candidatus Woesearchaeota archaeon]|nr:hypothetical protein [Candidatus Woesearchaeota archaeon]